MNAGRRRWSWEAPFPPIALSDEECEHIWRLAWSGGWRPTPAEIIGGQNTERLLRAVQERDMKPVIALTS